MKNVTSTYFLGGVASGTKLLFLEGDSPENDLIALEKYEEYVEKQIKYDTLYRHGKKPKELRLEKTVSSVMASITLEKVVRERKPAWTDKVVVETWDTVNEQTAMAEIKEAKEYYESRKENN